MLLLKLNIFNIRWIKDNSKIRVTYKKQRIASKHYDDIWYRKQQLTIEAISELQPDLV
jgi:ABC-type Fe3+-citrate transport system substrate-binding protein